MIITQQMMNEVYKIAEATELILTLAGGVTFGCTLRSTDEQINLFFKNEGEFWSFCTGFRLAKAKSK